MPERRAESMQPTTPTQQQKSVPINILANAAANGQIANGQQSFGSQQKDFPLHHGSLQQLNSSPSNPSMLKIAAIPPFPTAAQKLAQKESVGPASPSKSPSTPVLREASRERLNKYAAAGSPAIYQQQERQKPAAESPHPKYSFISKNGGGGIGGKDTGTGANSSRRSSRDGSDLLGGGSNLISHFKNLVNSFNSLNMSSKSGRSKSLSRGMSGDSNKSRQNHHNPIVLTPIGNQGGIKSSGKLSANPNNNEDTSATSGIGSASPTIRNKSREGTAADSDEQQIREQMMRRRRRERRSVERRIGGGEPAENTPNLAQAALVEQYTKELMRAGQQQQQQQQQRTATILLKHNGRYLGNL